MKTTSLLSLLALASACGLGVETDPELEDGATHGDDGAALEDAVAVSKTELARIDIGDGEVVYWIDEDGPAAGEITMLETTVPDKDGQLYIRDDGDRSPLEAFLEVTHESTPIPRALINDSETEEALELASEREQVDRLPGIVAGIVTERPSISSWSAVTMCNQGGTSAMFANEICTADDWTKDFCHNGTWYSVTDYTGSTHKSEWSRGRTLACNANGRQRHYYKVGGIWYKTIDGSVPSGTVYRFTRKGGAKWQRAITHSRTASGFVRGASHFYRFPF